MQTILAATESSSTSTATCLSEDDQPPGVHGLDIFSNDTNSSDARSLPISASVDSFRRTFFPTASAHDWNDWRWQLKNRLSTVEEFSRIFQLTESETTAFTQTCGIPVAVTPYYASIMHSGEHSSNGALKRCMLPSMMEYHKSPGEREDPLAEEHYSPIPGLVHRYSDRALFMVTDFCSCYCRYCTRSRLVGGGKKSSQARAMKLRWELAISWIAEHPEIKDVIISGGDPLTLTDSQIEFLLESIRAIKHVEIIRIGTKVPVVLPQRITKPLTKILKKFHPLFASIHFTHPDELTIENREACERLANAGLPLGSQTVLLKGINDSPETLSALMTGLLKHRVRPYYVYQCDPIIGSSHFRTTVRDGVNLIGALQGNISGYGIPHYVVDTPGGGGKISLLPNRIAETTPDGISLLNYQGQEFYYPEF